MKCTEEQKQRMKEYYKKNKDKIIKRNYEYAKRNNFKYEKTPNQRKTRNIKRKTRLYYPFQNNKCYYCGKLATERHHDTRPIKIHSFKFICHNCHLNIEKLEGGKQ